MRQAKVRLTKMASFLHACFSGMEYMQKKRLLRLIIPLVIMLSLTLGCQTDNEEKSVNTQIEALIPETEVKQTVKKDEKLNSDFAQYLEKIKFMQLPSTIACDDEYPDYPKVKEELKVKYTGGEREVPYRRISTNLNFEVVLNLAPADVELPIIKTYRKSGELISSQQMFHNYCGGEPGFFSTEYITIKSNLVITYVDSTWIYEVDSLDNEIESTKKLKVETFNYKILQSGEIVKEE